MTNHYLSVITGEESFLGFSRWCEIDLWLIPFWLVGEFTTHLRLPILVVGLGCS